MPSGSHVHTGIEVVGAVVKGPKPFVKVQAGRSVFYLTEDEGKGAKPGDIVRLKLVVTPLFASWVVAEIVTRFDVETTSSNVTEGAGIGDQAQGQGADAAAQGLREGEGG